MWWKRQIRSERWSWHASIVIDSHWPVTSPPKKYTSKHKRTRIVIRWFSAKETIEVIPILNESDYTVMIIMTIMIIGQLCCTALDELLFCHNKAWRSDHPTTMVKWIAFCLNNYWWKEIRPTLFNSLFLIGWPLNDRRTKTYTKRKRKRRITKSYCGWQWR